MVALSFGRATRHGRLRISLRSIKTYTIHYILNIPRISAGGNTSITGSLIGPRILLRIFLTIKSNYLRSFTIIGHSGSRKSIRLGLSRNQGTIQRRSTAGHIPHNTPRRSIHASGCGARIITSKTYTSKPKRIRHLHRKRNITIRAGTSTINITWKLDAAIQSGIPL